MKTIWIVMDIGISHWADIPLRNGKSARSLNLATVQNLSGGQYVIVSDRADGPNTLFQASWSLREILLGLRDKHESTDTLVFVFADQMLIDPKLASEVLDLHKQTVSQYTFADGYPSGLTVQAVQVSILEALAVLAEKNKIEYCRDFLFECLKTDINAFDLETVISSHDYRLSRLDLSAKGQLEFEYLKTLDEKLPEAQLLELLKEENLPQRTLPAFFNIQIAAGCPQSCSYCPYPSVHPGLLADKRIMDAGKFAQIVEKVSAFVEKAVFSVSLWGEPFMNPELFAIAKTVLENPGFELIIETSGIFDESEILKRLGSLSDDQKKRLSFVLSLDSINPTVYQKMRGDGLEKALENLDFLYTHFPGKVWAQVVRTEETEEDLLEFYRKYTAEKKSFIVQKYDWFCGKLAQKKVADLSPLHRFSCWHLKRDVNVLIDGTVCLCREDMEGKNSLGNIFQEDLKIIWNRGQERYLQHAQKQYSGLCSDCDEYYTFNF